MITRGFPNVVSQDLVASQAWYVDLFGWQVEYTSDWFVHLKAAQASGVELGILAAGHEIVPTGAGPGSSGTFLTIVVADVQEIRDRARELGVDVVEEPQDLFYGQRRMVVHDPDGTVIDVSSPSS